MRFLTHLGVQFGCSWNGTIRINGKRYVVGRGGVRIARIVNEMCAEFEETKKFRSTKSVPLFRMRNRIRKIHFIDANSENLKGGRLMLNLLIARTENSGVRKLAVWLRGRLGGRRGMRLISRFRNADDWRMRKEVARAVKRMKGWHILREIRDEDPNERVRFFATQRPLRPYSERLTDFMRSVEPRKIEERTWREVFISDSVSFSDACPPKSMWLIRRILNRMYASLR